jgi:hypothetical protein
MEWQLTIRQCDISRLSLADLSSYAFDVMLLLELGTCEVIVTSVLAAIDCDVKENYF